MLVSLRSMASLGVLCAALCASAGAVTVTWNDTGGNVPANGDDAVISAGAVLLSSNSSARGADG